MNIYEYNSSTVNEYSQDGFGILDDHSWVMDDFGNLSDEVSSNEDFYQIDCNQTIVPFGKLKIKGKETKYIRKTKEFKKFIDLNTNSIIFYGIIIRWIGFSIIFQLSNDSERKLIPDVSGGGLS